MRIESECVEVRGLNPSSSSPRGGSSRVTFPNRVVLVWSRWSRWSLRLLEIQRALPYPRRKLYRASGWSPVAIVRDLLG
jgi:predicted metalloenzyme YecM